MTVVTVLRRGMARQVLVSRLFSPHVNPTRMKLTSTLRPTICRVMTRNGSIRSAGGSFGKKEQAQEDQWAHQRHLRELQEKLKAAHDAVQEHTSKMIEKTKKNK